MQTPLPSIRLTHTPAHTPARTPALSVSPLLALCAPRCWYPLSYSMVPALSALEKVRHNAGLGNKPRL